MNGWVRRAACFEILKLYLGQTFSRLSWVANLDKVSAVNQYHTQVMKISANFNSWIATIAFTWGEQDYASYLRPSESDLPAYADHWVKRWRTCEDLAEPTGGSWSGRVDMSREERGRNQRMFREIQRTLQTTAVQKEAAEQQGLVPKNRFQNFVEEVATVAQLSTADNEEEEHGVPWEPAQMFRAIKSQ